MRLNFPADSVKVLGSDDGVSLRVRRMNQHPLYFVVCQGFVIHCGKRRHCLTKFNYYTGQVGQTIRAMGAAN